MVATLAFCYSLYKILKRYLELKGFKTKRQREKNEIERKMKHYYYHCERNPEGFLRLKAENFRKWEEEEKEKEE